MTKVVDVQTRSVRRFVRTPRQHALSEREPATTGPPDPPTVEGRGRP
ncbi:hypothetical protein ATKI12_8967 [Kitasatospora sp. Ki12]